MTELAHTGTPVWVLIALGIFLVCIGVSTWLFTERFFADKD